MSDKNTHCCCSKLAEEVFTGKFRKRLEQIDKYWWHTKIIGLLIVVISGAILFIFNSDHVWFSAGAIGIVIGMIILFACGPDRRKFFRHEVVPVLVKALSPDLQYAPDRGIAKNRFMQFDFFHYFDRYYSEDHLTGILGKTKIEVAEVHIEKRHRSKNKKDSYSTIFRGVIFIADFNKHFKCRTSVLPDTAEKCFGKLLGNFLQQMNFTEPGKLVKLENQEFEKQFAVYSTDPMEARYILTPLLMERLLALYNRENSPVRILFLNGNVIIAFERYCGWLEPPIWRKLADVAVLKNTLLEICNMVDLVEELDLNTRIWSKQ